MRKFLAVLCVCALVLPLGGCKTMDEYLRGIANAAAFVTTFLQSSKAAIDQSCQALRVAETEAAVPACRSKIAKLRAGVQAICANSALLTDDVAGNYVKAVGDAVKQAGAIKGTC